MKLISDTRETLPLHFQSVVGVEHVRGTLSFGDYTASYVIGGKEVTSSTVVERKAKGDLFSSYTSGYERERAKIIRAKVDGKKFILAIEGTATDILSGHTYTKGGVDYESKKDGMTMVRQLMTCCHKYGIVLWLCESREAMALMVQEYFLAEERFLKKQAEEEREKVSKEQGHRRAGTGLVE